MSTIIHGKPAPSGLLGRLLEQGIVLTAEWEELNAETRDYLLRLDYPEPLLSQLLRYHLITPFQSDAIQRGLSSELTIGQYRILSQLGQGGMGTVYRAEHMYLRRQVAVKVMTRSVGSNPRLLHRFYAEAHAVAKLHHSSIVTCFDAGRQTIPGSNSRDYFVMELVPGSDLAEFVRLRGPLSPGKACDLFRQLAEALVEAHRHRLVHRDIKPSNVQITPDWNAKLLDFGLALQPNQRMTEPGTLLGTIGYMAPEQARAAHSVDVRADLFSLGATMYWALSGKHPFPDTGNVLQDLTTRMTMGAADVRKVRPELPEELAEFILTLTDPDPDKRYPSARAVANVLAGFAGLFSVDGGSAPNRPTRVLIAEPDPEIRATIVGALTDCTCSEVQDGQAAWDLLEIEPFDLIVVDVNLPRISGPKILERLRTSSSAASRPKALVISGSIPIAALAGLLADDAGDFLSKPFTANELRLRVKQLAKRSPEGVSGAMPGIPALMRVTDAIPTSDMYRRSSSVTHQSAEEVACNLVSAWTTRLLEETNWCKAGYAERIGKYIRALAAACDDSGEYARLKDTRYLSMLVAVAPLHDSGFLIVPGEITRKGGSYSATENAVIESHTLQASQILIDLSMTLPGGGAMLHLAAEIVRHHHEEWSGRGYPDGLKEREIPLSARVVSLVSSYDAMRTRRPNHPAISHGSAVRLLGLSSTGEYDPTLVKAFLQAAPQFELASGSR